jgi:hypothetical protein
MSKRIDPVKLGIGTGLITGIATRSPGIGLGVGVGSAFIADALQGGKPKKTSKKTSAKRTIGTRAQVMHGTAMRTVGGLMKKDLKYNKSGRIVSKRKSANARRVLGRYSRK